MATSTAPGRMKHAPAKSATCPNNPCFDYDPKTGKPNLMDGEKVVVETKKHGIPLFITSAGRKIYLCSIADYVAKIAPLVNERLWWRWYPHAAPKEAIKATSEAVTALDQRIAALELGARQTAERNSELESENEALRLKLAAVEAEKSATRAQGQQHERGQGRPGK